MLKSVINGFIYGIAISSIMIAGPLYTEPKAMFKSDTVKALAEYTRPMRDLSYGNYCSSVSVAYKGEAYTLTNNHCCDAIPGKFPFIKILGNDVEGILYQSLEHDICILTSSQQSTTIELADEDSELLDEVMLLGWPRGEFLVPRFGHLVVKNVPIAVGYDNGVLVRPSHIVSTMSYGGNSGSPIFNKDMEVIGLLYAGHRYIHTYGIIVPLKYIRAAIEDLHSSIYQDMEELEQEGL